MKLEKIDPGKCPCCDDSMFDYRESLGVILCKACIFRTEQLEHLRSLQATRQFYLENKDKK